MNSFVSTFLCVHYIHAPLYCICVDHVYMYLQQVKEILQEEEDLSEIVQLVGKVRPLLYTTL